MNNTQSSPRSNIIIAIMLSALTYWLFAQSFINIGPLVGQTYQTSPAVLNLSISLTSFATGIFMVAAGDIADKIGQLRMTYMGLIISMFASLLLIISTSLHCSSSVEFYKVYQQLSCYLQQLAF